MTSLTAEKIISDAKKVASRLKERTVLGDALIMEAEYINDQLETLQSVQDEFEALNQLGRNNSNNEMINAINQEHPHLRDIQLQNRELRACLQDYQRALEHIMSKYREHTQKKILNSKITFNYLSPEDSKFSNRYVDKILEMVAVMQHAAQSDEDNYDRTTREQEILINKLVTENKGLREMLQISRDYGSIALTAPTEEKACQTDDDANLNDSDHAFNDSIASVVLGTTTAATTTGPVAGNDVLSTTNQINNNTINNNNTTPPPPTTATAATNTPSPPTSTDRSNEAPLLVSPSNKTATSGTSS